MLAISNMLAVTGLRHISAQGGDSQKKLRGLCAQGGGAGGRGGGIRAVVLAQVAP